MYSVNTTCITGAAYTGGSYYITQQTFIYMVNCGGAIIIRHSMVQWSEVLFPDAFGGSCASGVVATENLGGQFEGTTASECLYCN